MNKALVVVAHGSRREASNEEVRALAERLSRMPGNEYDSVTAAFLELAEPLIPDGVVQAIDAGVELFTATLVDDLLWEDGRVAGVRTRRGDLRSRVVVGADGVNSTVAEKANLMPKLKPEELGLIVRQILDLPAEVIEERLLLRPGEGALSMFIRQVQGPGGRTGVYHGEIYSNRDSLSMTLR